MSSRTHPQISIELETSFANGRLMPLLTTEDGTVGALFKNMKLPESFIQDFPNNPRSVEWDSLAYHHKIDLLRSLGELRGKSFEESRTIEGLIIKSQLELEFTETTTFMGKSYSPGEHIVDISPYFGQVEYASSGDLNKLRALELHFRGDLDASEMVASIRKFIQLTKLDVPNLHMHIVAEIPFDKLAHAPIKSSVALANLYRRIDLAAEMVDIIFLKNPPGISQSGGIIFQDTSKPHFISGIANYFYQLSQGNRINLNNKYKKAWAGFHGAGKYDNPNYWGIQLRQLLDDQDVHQLQSLTHASQEHMRTGLDQEIDLIQRWSIKNNIAPTDFQKLENLHYNQDWDQLINSASPQIKEIFENSRLLEDLKSIEHQNSATKMLIHNWSNDPMIWKNSRESQRIISAQIKALKQIEALNREQDYSYGRHVVEIVSNFLEESQLAKTVFESLNINDLL